MAPISKSPITFGWKQVKQYMTTVTGDSVEQITVPIPYDIGYQKNVICIAKMIGTPNKGVKFLPWKEAPHTSNPYRNNDIYHGIEEFVELVFSI